MDSYDIDKARNSVWNAIEFMHNAEGFLEQALKDLNSALQTWQHPYGYENVVAYMTAIKNITNELAHLRHKLLRINQEMYNLMAELEPYEMALP